jgi:catechol 2,3-dioxygenase-like lactoylglutathione lyase family enzyme
MIDSAAGISVITLGVSDVDASIRFYRDGLGFAVGAVKGSVTYFDTGGTWLALFPRDALARYANVSAEGEGFTGVTLSRNADTREAVDALMAVVGPITFSSHVTCSSSDLSRGRSP